MPKTSTFCCAAAAALLASPWCAAPAEADSPGDIKPVAVVSLSGYNEWKADLGYVGEISGRPDLVAGLENILTLLTQNRGPEGLDKDRPWGLVVHVDREKLAQGVRDPKRLMVVCGFLPVTDLDALADAMAPIVGQPERYNAGWLRIEKGGKSTFLKQVGDWAFFAPKLEFLDTVPEHPLELLGGLNEQYDVAIRLQLDNLPDEIRQKAIADMKRKAAAGLPRKSGESDQQYAARTIFGRRLMQTAVAAAEDLQQVTFGWTLDHETGESYLDLTVSARAGTPTAEGLAALGRRTSDFRGFLLPGAAASCNGSFAFRPFDTADLATMFDAVRTQADEQVDRKGKSAEQREAGKRLVQGLLDVIEQTLATGRLDGAVAVKLDPDAVTLATGGYVADADALEQTLAEWVEAVRAEHPAFVDRVLSTDVAHYRGVRFHRVSLPLPANAKDRPKLVRMFGETFDVLVGIGRETFYLAAGKEPRAMLEAAIRGSEQEGSQQATPVEASISVGSVAGFVAELGKPKDKAKAERIARLLEESGGEDHLTLAANPVPQGVQFRLRVEKGLLRAIGVMASKRGGQAAGTRTPAVSQGAGL